MSHGPWAEPLNSRRWLSSFLTYSYHIKATHPNWSVSTCTSVWWDWGGWNWNLHSLKACAMLSTSVSDCTRDLEHLAWVFLGCHNKISQAGWLKYQKIKLSQFWKLEVQDPSIGRIHSEASLLGLQMALFSLCLHMVIPLCGSVSNSLIRIP